MKKSLVVLGMVLSLFTVTACGSSTEVQESAITAEQAASFADSYVGLIADVSAQGVDIEANADYFESYCGVDADTMTSAVDSYNSAIEEIGDYQSISDAAFTQDDTTLTITCVVNGVSKTADATLTFDLTTGMMTAATFSVNYSIGELMTNAGLNTILGLGTVFIVLVLLWGVIACFRIVPYLQNKKKNTPAAAKTDSVDNAVAQIVSNEEAQDDTELIAVIAAAIAASEGAASTDGYVVRSVRRRY